MPILLHVLRFCLPVLLYLSSLPAWAEQTGSIQFYFAYGAYSTYAGARSINGVNNTQHHDTQVSVAGRLVAPKTNTTKPEDSSFQNFWCNSQKFFNHEYKNTTFNLKLGTQYWTLQTDSEGYFHTRITLSDPMTPGWHNIHAQGQAPQAEGQGRLLLVPPENTLGIISDIDDTLLISEVPHKHRLLKNTFLKNPLQRQAVPGVSALYHQLAAQNPYPDSSPIFYLSASPRQLHHNITQFLAHHTFPEGILITRRIGLDHASDALLDTMTYKKQKIEEILMQLPRVHFILVGDDGEKDPEIYDEIRQHYPDRIKAIWIRRVHPNPERQRFPEQQDLTRLISRDTAQSLKPAQPQP